MVIVYVKYGEEDARGSRGFFADVRVGFGQGTRDLCMLEQRLAESES